MKPIVVLQHVPHEGLGVLEECFAMEGLACRVWDVLDDAMADTVFLPGDYAGLVVLGGPMNVDDTDKYPQLAVEVRWLKKAVAAGLPVLGICLGSQLLAKSLGSTVRPNGIKEIGWYEVEFTPDGQADPLFEGCQQRETAFQWHGDTFDLPDGAVHLARSADCELQAFRFGESAYGLQFHWEVTPELIEEWLSETGNCGELSDLDYIDPAEIRRKIPSEMTKMQPVAERVFSRFAQLCREPD